MDLKPGFALINGLFHVPVTLDAILDEIPAGVMLLDSDRRVVFINRALSALTGYDTAEVAGLSCYVVLRSSVCLQQCKYSDPNENNCSSGMADIINRQKEKIPVRLSLSPISDESGEAAGFLEVVEDFRVQQKEGGGLNRPGNLVGTCPQMEKIFNILPMVAQTDSPILITGESGTGKDLLAESIHLSSERAKGPFIKVNCSALPEILLESELFGHRKGAFAGAAENKAGRFRLANNGTVYLSEVGDLPLGLQSKLLAFLDENMFYPLGSTQGVEANVRIIAATMYPLDQLVMKGRFRSDLLYRLNVIRLDLPPLRERGGDIRLLLEHVLRKMEGEFNKGIKGISDEALDLLLAYHFPGNIRELMNVVEYAVSVNQSNVILKSDLPEYIVEETMGRKKPFSPMVSHANLVHNRTVDSDGDATWMDMEKKMIFEALVAAKGKKNRAADILGWGRSTLWRKMKKYGLDKT